MQKRIKEIYVEHDFPKPDATPKVFWNILEGEHVTLVRVKDIASGYFPKAPNDKHIFIVN